MKVLYDHQAFTIQEYGGISRYFYELILQFKDNPSINVRNTLLFSNNDYIKDDTIIKSTPFFKRINLQRKIELMNSMNEYKSYVQYKQNNFDIFHPTYYDTYYLKTKIDKPTVITFHDLIHEKFMPNDQKTLNNKKHSLSRADKIIAVSQNSKNDLMDYYNIPDEKIKVIPLASSISTSHHFNKDEMLTKYILYVGGRNQYKNFLFFVKAVAPLLLRQTDLHLYCVGGGKFSKEETSILYELKLLQKVKHFPGNDENLTKYYSNALAFIFPSLYEGFGMPLLEAMNCGCPIGASQTSALAEVGGNAAMYFNPYDKDSILAVTEAIVLQEPIRKNLITNGYIRALDFSWEKTSRLTHEVYNELISN